MIEPEFLNQPFALRQVCACRNGHVRCERNVRSEIRTQYALVQLIVKCRDLDGALVGYQEDVTAAAHLVRDRLGTADRESIGLADAATAATSAATSAGDALIGNTSVK